MQKNKIFVGNLAYSTSQDRLQEVFLKYGAIIDCYKPEGKGFGFVTFETEEQAQNAIEAMNGFELDGRELVVNIAQPKTDKPRGGFGGGRGGYGAGNSRGGYGGGNSRGGYGGDRRERRDRY